MVLQNRLSSFSATRLNPSTFVIAEDDSYGEQPLIYAKIYSDPPVLVLTDTGTNSPSKRSKHGIILLSPQDRNKYLTTPTARFTTLRSFLENCPVATNENKPLNPGGHLKYITIITHCHYDHILGLEPFLPSSTTEVIASLTGRAFISSNLWEHSLCRSLNLPDPSFYRPNIFARHLCRLWLSYSGRVSGAPAGLRGGKNDLGITFLSTPGHTPDQLAWYDHAERHLFVGDSVYTSGDEGMPIIFPSEGDLVTYIRSMQMLISFVKTQNAASLAGGDGRRVRIACGHVDCDADAGKMLSTVLAFVNCVVDGKIPVAERSMRRGEETLLFWWNDRKDYGLRLPSRLLTAARELGWQGCCTGTSDGS